MEDKIIINYHYVRDANDEIRGINSCSVGEFERQINFLCKEYEIVSVPNIFKVAKNDIPGKFCALTFDDCLKDVYNNVVPVLKKNNAKATLFLISSVLEEYLPSAHKVHLLLSKFSPSELINAFNSHIDVLGPDFKKYHIPDNQRLYQDRRLDDDIDTANLKETFTLLPNQIKENFISILFNKLGLNEKVMVEEMFMNAREINELCVQGFYLGDHSYSHANLTMMSVGDIKKDLSKSKKKIADLCGYNVKIFSYPSGRWNNVVLDILKETGFELALTINERGLHNLENPLLLPRYDTNFVRDYIKNVK